MLAFAFVIVGLFVIVIGGAFVYVEIVESGDDWDD